MRVYICAVGRLKSGPELDLIRDYLDRFDKTGRNLGLGPAQFLEVEDKKGGGKGSEAAVLTRAIPKGSLICSMDERGQTLNSPDFAHQLGKWRDMGQSSVAFVIGGADGLEQSFLNQSDFKLSFGKMVWPHMLARVMLSEQLYRAASILANAPYHRA